VNCAFSLLPSRALIAPPRWKRRRFYTAIAEAEERVHSLNCLRLVVVHFVRIDVEGDAGLSVAKSRGYLLNVHSAAYEYGCVRVA
jgi:hypothetical protein